MVFPCVHAFDVRNHFPAYHTWQSFTSYRWRTANDDEARDPVRWRIDYSADCATNWRVVDDRSTIVQSVPLNRFTWTASFTLVRGRGCALRSSREVQPRPPFVRLSGCLD
jgi:hypothetical protein